MKKCPACGRMTDYKFCPDCGENLWTPEGITICPECGYEASTRFCPECGCKLDVEASIDQYQMTEDDEKQIELEDNIVAELIADEEIPVIIPRNIKNGISKELIASLLEDM